MASPSILDRQLLIVTGNGGVGKSPVAAAIALLAQQNGKRVLAVELDAKGNLAESFAGAGGASQAPHVGYTPTELLPRLSVMAMDAEASLREYLKINLRLPFVTKVSALSAAFDFLANAAPGVREIVTIGKVAYEVRERHYDLVVVDASATGHVIGLLRAPQAINDLVGVGLIQGQTRWILDILHDPARTGVIAVTTPEEIPVNETIDLQQRLRRETDVEIASFVVNRVLPPLFDDERDLARFAQLTGKPSSLNKFFESKEDHAIAGLLRSAQLSIALNEQQDRQLDHLLDRIDPFDGPIAYVPQLFDVTTGLRVTRQVADVLSDEWNSA